MNENKTYKREVAAGLLVVYLGLLIAGIWLPEAASAAESLKHEVFIFAGAAFALDAYSKQINR